MTSRRNIVHFSFKRPKHDWKPIYIECDCDFTSSNTYQVTNHDYVSNVILSYIRNHVYDHLFSQYLPYSCNIVIESYVGNIYSILLHYLRDEITIIIPSLGLSFITENNVLQCPQIFRFDPKCIVNDCDLSVYNKSLCPEHYDQWSVIPQQFIHKHKCDLCQTRLKPHRISLIMKLNSTICYNIAHYISSFFEIYCQGHMLPRDYKCKKCDDTFSFDFGTVINDDTVVDDMFGF
jgi:hypothetical protein